MLDNGRQRTKETVHLNTFGEEGFSKNGRMYASSLKGINSEIIQVTALTVPKFCSVFPPSVERLKDYSHVENLELADHFILTMIVIQWIC